MLADTGTPLPLTPRPVARSLDELLDGLERREPFVTNESRSQSAFERVWLRDHGEPLVLKFICIDHDFTMRASGDVGSRTVRAFEAGLLDVAADVIDHTTVAAALGLGPNGRDSALLMRDISAHLLPPGDGPFRAEHHEQFVDHLAALCARTWGWTDDVGLMPYEARWMLFSVDAIDCERALGWPERVPQVAEEGWTQFARRAPKPIADAIDALRRDVAPLADALRRTPSCLLHGDWKASNLGVAPDGRTILVDWAYVGEGPACHELGWYLALNRSKLPESKESTIERFRAALEQHGVATAGWWDRQLGLALLGTLVQFGWEKALGDDDELQWWCDRAAAGLDLL